MFTHFDYYRKVEQEFYAFKLRVNGKPVVKKAINVS